MNITSISNVLAGTPTWVWVALGYLLVIGIMALYDRVVYVPRLFVMPLVMAVLSYRTFSLMSASSIVALLCFLLLGGLGGYWMAQRTPVKVFKDTWSVGIPGSCRLLVMLLLFFGIKFAFGYAKATDYFAGSYSVVDLSIVEAWFSALFSGYFLGHAVAWVRKFRA